LRDLVTSWTKQRVLIFAAQLAFARAGFRAKMQIHYLGRYLINAGRCIITTSAASFYVCLSYTLLVEPAVALADLDP
jgi:hypothetical protein